MDTNTNKQSLASNGAPGWCYVLAVVLLGVFAGLAVVSMGGDAATWDETHYLGVGTYLLQEQRWDVPSARLHPPLSFYLNSLPLLVRGFDASGFEVGEAYDYGVGIARGRALMAAPGLGGERLLFWSRLSTVLLGMMLGWFVFRWSCDLHGWGGGLVSLAVYCFCPNVLAHARLITPDMALSGVGFVAWYFWWRACRVGGGRQVWLAGALLGLTLLSKFSALLWPPMFLVGAVFGANGNWWGRARMCGVAFLVAGLVLSLGYGFQVVEYVRGVLTQYHLSGSGQEPSYLMGEVSLRGWRSYYLIALLVKLTLPLWLLVTATALTRIGGGWLRGPRRRFGLVETSWREALFLWLPVVAFVGVFSVVSRVNIGLRYVLPAVPFLMVWIGGIWAAVQRMGTWRRWAQVGVGLLLAWQMYAGVSTYPHYLAYFNEAAGGPARGHEWLLDSNLDWGQDLKRLAGFMRENGIEEVQLSYFGTADPHLYGIQYEALPSMTPLDARYASRGIEPGDWLAVSVTNLYGLYVSLGELGERLRGSRPVGRVGHSIYVYRADFEMELEVAIPLGGRSRGGEGKAGAAIACALGS